jgi:hypothetical protein
MEAQCWSGENWPKEEVLKPAQSPNPVFQTTLGWYFCTETWTECYGPYPNETAVQAALEKYCHWLEYGP